MITKPLCFFYSDATPDSGPSSLNGGQFDPLTKTAVISTAQSNMPIVNYTKPNWTQHIMRKPTGSSTPATTAVYTSDSSASLATAKNQLSDTRTPDSDCDSERKYPDLLDISSFSGNIPPNSSNTSNSKTATSNSSAFCTFPRKKHSSGKYMKAVSESQSPLLPSDCSSRYGSSNFSGENEPINRRLSIDSYSNYPLSVYSANKDAGRSSSFLNLMAPQNGKVYQVPRRNPSLPSSPTKESKKSFSPNETPLLDFISLASRNSNIVGTPSPSTSTSVSAYDYHAAQLERFLEEYRNLQEQLCKMKETCDSIRKKETPHRSTIGQSAKLADPAMYTAAALSSTPTLPDDASTNPKGILKNKALPGQPPDPPPYWLHRNAILKRLQEPSAGEFFKS